MWKVSDRDNSVYLLGSFHALKPQDYPLPSKIYAAFDDAEVVAFELSPEEMASPQLPLRMVAAATLPAGSSLQHALSPKGWQQLQHYAARRNLPLDRFVQLEPWFVSMVITMREMAAVGYDPALGLDQHLIKRSAEAGKKTLGLETGDEQIAALDSMSAVEQRQSLAESLGEVDKFGSQLAKLHDYWIAGDEVALDKLLSEEFKQNYAQLYQRINVQRNQAWLPKVRRMLDGEQSDDTLVVVGSLHLLGADGLVAQMRKHGYSVERL